jgi:hypothetical protein
VGEQRGREGDVVCDCGVYECVCSCVWWKWGERRRATSSVLADAGGQLVILEAEMVLWRNFDLDDVIVKGQ